MWASDEAHLRGPSSRWPGFCVAAAMCWAAERDGSSPYRVRWQRTGQRCTFDIVFQVRFLFASIRLAAVHHSVDNDTSSMHSEGFSAMNRLSLHTFLLGLAVVFYATTTGKYALRFFRSTYQCSPSFHFNSGVPNLHGVSAPLGVSDANPGGIGLVSEK